MPTPDNATAKPARARPRFCSSIESADFRPPQAIGRASRAALLREAFWGRGVRLRVAFLAGEPDLHRRVATLAQAWADETGADFSFEFWIDSTRDPTAADVRVTFEPDLGSFAILGRNAETADRTERTMNLGWMSLDLDEEEARSVVLHEFGHALGLVHEHMNPARPIEWDREQVIADLQASQGWSEDTIETNMFAQYRAGETFHTDIDLLSIMTYQIPPEWTLDGFSTRSNAALSAADLALIREAYGIRRGFGG